MTFFMHCHLFQTWNNTPSICEVLNCSALCGVAKPWGEGQSTVSWFPEWHLGLRERRCCSYRVAPPPLTVEKVPKKMETIFTETLVFFSILTAQKSTCDVWYHCKQYFLFLGNRLMPLCTVIIQFLQYTLSSTTLFVLTRFQFNQQTTVLDV